jgi:hypothetical protein
MDFERNVSPVVIMLHLFPIATDSLRYIVAIISRLFLINSVIVSVA